jgi:DNA-binding SARP family transcriptional activator
VQFLVLGPLVAISDARTPLDLGTPKAHATLAVLLCRAGEVVSVDAIVDALWPESPPAAAVKNVQLYVHQLRRALGDAGRITRRSGGYLLATQPGEIDARRFSGLVGQQATAAAAGDLEAARSLLVQALRLWRGERAYAGIGAVPPVSAEARRLAEVRLAALSSRIDIDVRLGGHAELVPELVGLTGQHPLHERFWAQLMIVLHRSGRTAEALAAYDRARRIIAEETGLDPGMELRDLQQGILTGAADMPSSHALPPGRLTPRMLPPDSADFTGRLGELPVLTAALGGSEEPAGAPRPACGVPVVALSGQGGVGKTALAVHAAHTLADSYPDGQLFAVLSGTQPAPADPDQVLGRFLRALGVPVQAIPDEGEERAALYRSMVGGRRVLVVLDDAADEAQVLPLLPGTASCAVIVTSRARLGALPGVRHVDLAPLPAEDGLRLLERIAGLARTASDPCASRQLVGVCAGLPLALRIAGSRLASRPHWSVGELAGQLADERKRLDALRHRDLELRASFALSYRGLGPAEQRLFRLLGLLDAPDVAVWTAAALLDTSPAEAGQLLEILADARMVEVTGSGQADQRRYRLHDLVRIYARELAECVDSPEARTDALARAFGVPRLIPSLNSACTAG